MSSMYPYGGTSTQVCQRCGQPLSPGEAQCRNCGYYNQQQFSSNMSWGTPAASAPAPQEQTAYGQNQFAEMQWGQSGVPYAQPDGFSQPQQPFSGAFAQPQPQPSSPSYPRNFSAAPAQPANPNAGAPGQSGQFWQPGQQFGQGNFYGTTAVTGQSSPSNPNKNNMYGMSGSRPDYYGAPAPGGQQGFYTSMPQAMPGSFQTTGDNGYQPGGYSQPPERKRKPKIGLIIGVIVLLMVLIGGSFGAYTYLKHHTTPAATVLTPTPTATPSGPPLFSDTFQNNNSGWDLTSEPGKFSVKVGNGTLVLEDDENRLLPELVPSDKSFSNFRLSVDAILSKGTSDNGYGVYIRVASNQNSALATDYRFEIYGDGTYNVFKGTVDANGNSSSNPLVKYGSNAAIQKAGSVNHLTIIANGPSIIFIVNGQTIATATDSSYTSGSIALFVSNVQGTTPGAAATFSKLSIYPAQA